MPHDKRRRLSFFGLALFAHAIVFYLICHMVIFPAAPAVTDSAAFAPAAISTHPATTPPPPASASQTMSIAVPAAPAPVVAITAPVPSSFTMPKIDMPTVQATMPSLAASQNAGTTPSHTGGGNQTGTSSPGTGAAVTSDYGTLNNALLNDGREGIVLGIYWEGSLPRKDANTFDAIRQRLVTAIGWTLADRRETDTPGVKYGSDIPEVAQYADFFTPNGNDDSILNAPLVISSVPIHDKIKTMVLLAAFSHETTFRVDEFQQKRMDDNLASATNTYINYLRTYHIRLCVISFKNEPYPAIANYVKESGGVILYTQGVPPDQIANELKDAATAK